MPPHPTRYQRVLAARCGFGVVGYGLWVGERVLETCAESTLMKALRSDLSTFNPKPSTQNVRRTLMLLVLTAAVLFLDARLLRGLLLHRAGRGRRRQADSARRGRWRWLGYGFVVVVGRASVGVSLGTVFY